MYPLKRYDGRFQQLDPLLAFYWGEEEHQLFGSLCTFLSGEAMCCTGPSNPLLTAPYSFSLIAAASFLTKSCLWGWKFQWRNHRRSRKEEKILKFSFLGIFQTKVNPSPMLLFVPWEERLAIYIHLLNEKQNGEHFVWGKCPREKGLSRSFSYALPQAWIGTPTPATLRKDYWKYMYVPLNGWKLG